MIDALIILFLFVGIVALLARNSVVDRMADMRIEEATVWIGLRGMNKVWAGRAELTIPVGSVTKVSVDPNPQALPGGLRLPGVWIPRLLIAGSYRRPGFRSFFAIRYGRNALVLDLEAHEYDRVVVDVDEPELLADEINRAAGIA